MTIRRHAAASGPREPRAPKLGETLLRHILLFRHATAVDTCLTRDNMCTVLRAGDAAPR